MNQFGLSTMCYNFIRDLLLWCVGIRFWEWYESIRRTESLVLSIIVKSLSYMVVYVVFLKRGISCRSTSHRKVVRFFDWDEQTISPHSPGRRTLRVHFRAVDYSWIIRIKKWFRTIFEVLLIPQLFCMMLEMLCDHNILKLMLKNLI